ncbi:hypothetical protein VTO42DRAFT_2845 [Malbranchea cinnamomea]
MAPVTRSFGRLAASVARQASTATTAAARPIRHHPVLLPSTSYPIAAAAAAAASHAQTRHFSVTPFRRSDESSLNNEGKESGEIVGEGDESSLAFASEEGELGAPEEEGGIEDEETLDPLILRQIDHDVQEIEREIPLTFTETGGKRQRLGFWAMSEEDDMAMVEDEEFQDDSITSMAHAELEEHRELRHYARIIAWDMPSLSNLAKPFTLPPETHLLRFRYTTYMGESHPAENKVVMELCSKDLVPKYLTEDQRITLLKLVGTRYNPDKDLIRMSCEKFPSRAQNKRYLGDLINTLIKEAKEGDSFKDIPLDLRHHKPQRKVYFPQEWAMTPERKAQLEAQRKQRKQAELERMRIVDGKEVIAQAMQQRLAAPEKSQAQAEKVPLPVRGQSTKQRRK